MEDSEKEFSKRRNRFSNRNGGEVEELTSFSNPNGGDPGQLLLLLLPLREIQTKVIIPNLLHLLLLLLLVVVEVVKPMRCFFNRNGDDQIQGLQLLLIPGTKIINKRTRPSNLLPNQPTSSSAPPPPDYALPNLETLQISKQSPTSSFLLQKYDRVTPIRRPDNGGTSAILTSRLRVNHFPVNFNPDGTIMHYNVAVKAKFSSKHGRPQRLSKSDLTMIREKLFSDDPHRLPLEMTAHDGAKNIFSAVQLPQETFTVDISEGEDEKSASYSVTITLVNTLRLHKLMDYLSGHILSTPRDILQGMDVVMKENPARRTISVGRSFYPMDPPLVMKDLHHGIIAVGGYQHSLKPTSQGLSLCVDYSVLAFRKRMSVLNFLHEHIDNFNLDEFESFRKHVEEALIGLKVNVTRRKSKQKYVIGRLTPMNTRYVTFPIDNAKGWSLSKDVSLLSFFKDKYGKDIVHKDIPCLDLGKGNKKNYVPMEFCVLVDDQRYPKERLDGYAAKTLKAMSLAHPNDRECAIQKMVQSSDGPCGPV